MISPLTAVISIITELLRALPVQESLRNHPLSRICSLMVLRSSS